MATTDTEVSIGTALAIGLGAVKATDTLKYILVSAGFDRIPSAAKSLLATGIAVGTSVLLEQGVRRRVLTACAATGIAGLAHSFERAQHHAGDVSKLVFLQEGARRR